MWYFFCLMYSRMLSTFEGALYLLCEIGVKSLTLEILPDDLTVACVACSAAVRNLRFFARVMASAPSLLLRQGSTMMASVALQTGQLVTASPVFGGAYAAVCMTQQAAAGSCGSRAFSRERQNPPRGPFCHPHHFVAGYGPLLFLHCL